MPGVMEETSTCLHREPGQLPRIIMMCAYVRFFGIERNEMSAVLCLLHTVELCQTGLVTVLSWYQYILLPSTINELWNIFLNLRADRWQTDNLRKTKTPIMRRIM